MEPFSFSFFGISGWGIDWDYCDFWMVCLGKELVSQIEDVKKKQILLIILKSSGLVREVDSALVILCDSVPVYLPRKLSLWQKIVVKIDDII